MDSQMISFNGPQISRSRPPSASPQNNFLPYSIQALLHQNLDKQNDLPTFDLYGEPLVCLSINGEERLCLAQISARLLRYYSYNEIHNRRVALGITCVQCSPRQLEMLRRVGAMPLSSRRCGTITKREAQRLVESFLQQLPSPPRLPENFAFEVEHHCGWGCTGYFIPARYNSSRAKCVQCSFCQIFFSPNKFIFHYHGTAETGNRKAATNYRHPDAANFNAWRRHLLIANPKPPENVLYAWEDVKAMFNGGSRVRKSTASSRYGTDQNKQGAPLMHQWMNPANHVVTPPESHPNSPTTKMPEPLFSTHVNCRLKTREGISLSQHMVDRSNKMMTIWTESLREYLDNVTKGIFLPPPTPPSPPLPPRTGR